MELCMSILSVKLWKIMKYFINHKQLFPINLILVMEYFVHFMKKYFSITFKYKYVHTN